MLSVTATTAATFAAAAAAVGAVVVAVALAVVVAVIGLGGSVCGCESGYLCLCLWLEVSVVVDVS